MQVGTRIPRNANVVQLIRSNACFGQAPLDRLRREACTIFEPIEAFFLSRGDKAPVLEQACRRASMVGVDAENVQALVLPTSDLSRLCPGTGPATLERVDMCELSLVKSSKSATPVPPYRAGRPGAG